MNSRTALRGSFVSKHFVAMALILAAALLGLTGALAIHELVPAGVAPSNTLQFVNGSAWDSSDRRHGTQAVGGIDVSPAAYRSPGDQRGGPRD
jgi:hypothetical protein